MLSLRKKQKQRQQQNNVLSMNDAFGESIQDGYSIFLHAKITLSTLLNTAKKKLPCYTKILDHTHKKVSNYNQ
jgi:hypothetical protein